MLQIANPIYDAVFKFMMNDNEVAKLLLSAIIGESIQSLDFQPTEINPSLQDSLTVLRMDFKAVMVTQNGAIKTAIIEIQKAKLHTDIMRFRRYLGAQYQDKNNSEVVKRVESQKKGVWIEHRKAFPILSIYFLGHSLENIPDVPVIKVARNYYDLATGEPLQAKEDFIESPTHDSYVIQIPYLKGNQRTELEQLLQIFSQEDAEESSVQQTLTISESDIPVQYHPVLRRLLLAIADTKTRQLMDAEDDLIYELKQYARTINEMKEEVNEMKEEVNEMKEEVNEMKAVVEEKDKLIEALMKQLEDQKK
ncbi:MAG: hypothetical protein AAGJ18_06660 [Bacteroidota bacterium]